MSGYHEGWTSLGQQVLQRGVKRNTKFGFMGAGVLIGLVAIAAVWSLDYALAEGESS